MLLILLLFDDFGVFRGQCAKLVLLLLFLCFRYGVPLYPEVRRVLEVKLMGLRTLPKILHDFLVDSEQAPQSGLALLHGGGFRDLSFEVCFAMVGLLILLLLLSP